MSELREADENRGEGRESKREKLIHNIVFPQRSRRFFVNSLSSFFSAGDYQALGIARFAPLCGYSEDSDEDEKTNKTFTRYYKYLQNLLQHRLIRSVPVLFAMWLQ